MMSSLRSEYEENRLARRFQNTSVVVVIPFYNGSRFIERSVQSVLDQTIAPTELIVVDDGSRPDESRRLKEIADGMGFSVLRKENGGQGSARNAGVAASRSDYICFLDQDDFFLKDHIETLIAAMPERDPHFGWVYGDLFEADGAGNIVKTNIVQDHSIHPKKNLLNILSYDMFVLPSASLISRAAFDHVGGFDVQFIGYEDDDLFLRIFRSGFTNYFTEKSVTVWCINGESASHSIRMARSRMLYFKKLVSQYPDEKEKSRYYIRDALIPRFHHLIMSEASSAALGKSGKYTDHKEEYLGIADEYVSLVREQPSASRFLKLRIALHVRLMRNTGYRYFYMARPILDAMVRVTNLFRSRRR